jgi:hypothetical protein
VAILLYAILSEFVSSPWDTEITPKRSSRALKQPIRTPNATVLAVQARLLGVVNGLDMGFSEITVKTGFGVDWGDWGGTVVLIRRVPLSFLKNISPPDELR